MADILLVRQDQAIPEADLEVARRVIFGMVDGLGDRGRKQWRGLWRRIFGLEPGEMMEIKTHQDRIGKYHRKHMLLEQRVFNSQERFPDFPAFRTWLKVGAGFVDWFPGPKGGVIPVPKSISYAKLEQGEMEEFHRDAVQFLRTEHAQKTLWPAMPALHRFEAIERLLEALGE